MHKILSVQIYFNIAIHQYSIENGIIYEKWTRDSYHEHTRRVE